MVRKRINEKLYLNKIKEINKHNKLYYIEDNPIISDKEYDELKKEILELESKYNFLNHKDSPQKSWF